MVCQTASQTRFRALKHENGIAAEQFQTFQQFAAPSSLDLYYMALLQPEQDCNMSYFPTELQLDEYMTLSGQRSSDLYGLNVKPPNALGGFVKQLPSYTAQVESSVKDSQCVLPHRLNPPDKPMNAFCPPQKKFLIFDRSGNHTRLFYSPTFPPQPQILVTKNPASHIGMHEKVALQVDHPSLEKHALEGILDKNHLTDGEGEMLEDSEEIDALLYSNTDDEFDESSDDDDDGGNDEVTSMIKTQTSNEEGCCDKILIEEITEEVASSDGTQKRQKLVDGWYTKSSLLNVNGPIRHAGLCTYEDDVECSYAGARKSGDGFDLSRQEQRIKIFEFLKTLASIIPDLDSNNPLHIIEKAIAFLKSMRLEAEACTLDNPDHQSASSLEPNLFQDGPSLSRIVSGQ